MENHSIFRTRLLSLTALLTFSLCAPQILPQTGFGVAYAQSRKVSGVVSDAQGQPLIGAGVLVKGQANVGTITDAEGKFSIDVKKGDVLEISYVGYETKEVTVDGNTVNVVLSEDQNFLEDVIVIGYGTMARKDISSSIATVSAKDLNMSAYSSTSQMLQGRVTGLTITNTGDPNGSGSISLRGASSLRSGSAMEPYYIVDGVPGISMSAISPDDIESIDVLRDASATAIYGSKAANGVIIVTTKKGQQDRSSITYSGYAAWDKATNLLEMMSADELRSYAKENNFTLINDEGANTNWQKEVLRTGFKHSHNLSLSGGNKKTQYNASINYINREGVIKTSGMNKISGRAFVQTKGLHDRLQVSVNVNASVSNHNYFSTGSGDGESPIFSMYYFSPLCPVKNADGSWYDGTTVATQNYNPVASLHENIYDSTNKMLQGIAKASLTIFDGLVWNTTGSYQNTQYLGNSYYTSKSQRASAASKNGLASRSTSEGKQTQLETYLTYDKLFAQVHKVGAMVGYSWEESKSGDGFGLSAYNFYDDSTTYHNFGLANSINTNDIYSNLLTTMRMISFYGRVNYSYDSKYIFQATIRRDGSSAFGANNRWGTFPSASLAWRAIQEDFMKNQNVFSDLKFRVGYGVSGNSLGFGAYESVERYAQSGWFNYTDANGNTERYRTIAAVSNANPDLKWERTAMLNAGIDFGFFNNRLTGTIEYYNKKTSDLIYSYPVSTNRYPYGSMTANVGNITNNGIELSITAIPVQTRNFNYRTTLNLSHNENEVTKMSNETYSTDYVNMLNPNIGGYSSVNIMRLQEGKPIGSFYVWEWAGYNEAGTSVFNDYDENGNLVGTTAAPTEEDRVYKGNAQPKLTVGWNNDFSYKKWSLNAFFQGTIGNKIYNGPRNYFSSVNLVQTCKNALKSIMTEQKFTDAAAQCPSDRYLENGSYIRLATLQLAYNFGKISDWINDLTVYATGNNVFTITKYSGTDPEVYLGGLTPGFDDQQSRYPLTRSLMLGVKVNF